MGVNVTLLTNSPLWIADKAIGKCWDKPKDECDVARIERVANKNKHASTIEHLIYSFDITMSRACLQEWARHRMASPSVKSTRYTLKELKDEDTFTSGMSMLELKEKYTNASEVYEDIHMQRAEKYLVFTDILGVDFSSVVALENLRLMLKDGVANDKAKFCLPESYKTSMVWTINARSLQNFLALRTPPAALWEIRNLAYELYDNLPEDHKFLFKEYLYEDSN